MPVVETIQITDPKELAVRIADVFAAWENTGPPSGRYLRKVTNLSMAMVQLQDGSLLVTLAFDLERVLRKAEVVTKKRPPDRDSI